MQHHASTGEPGRRPTTPAHRLNRLAPYAASVRDALRAIMPGRRAILCAVALLPVFYGLYYAAFWLRFEGRFGPIESWQFRSTVACVLMIKLCVFGWFRVYQGWSRFVTFHDLMTLGQAATGSLLLQVLADYFFFPQLAIPRSVFLMDWGMTMAVLGGLRSLSRVIHERRGVPFLSYGRRPVFIVGANDSGEALLRSIRRNRRLGYEVAAFLADDAGLLGTRIGGVPVAGTLDDTSHLAAKYGVADVFITAGELPGHRVRQLVDDCRRAGVTVKVVPSYEQLVEGEVSLRPRQVSIEDLLRREPVQLHMSELREWIDDRVLLVTGSAGSIGSEISRQLLQFSPRRLVLVDRSECGQFYLERELRRLAPDVPLDVCLADVSDGPRMAQLFHRHRPDIVFHAAAYKHVPLMEMNPGEAIKNICLATRVTADLAEQAGVESFVQVSTDKAVNPANVMGVCKRIAELYIQSRARKSRCRFVTVRFGNVLDSAGSVVPIFREQIDNGGPVTVTHPDMVRYFMTIPEASQLVIQAGAMGRGGEIFVLDMGPPVKIVDLARDMIRLSGLRVDEDIELRFVGPRPGEKLFEELHSARERRQATSHDKITIADCEPAPPDFAQEMRQLERLVSAPDDVIRRELARLVPGYGPDRSPAGAASSRIYAA